MNLVDVGFGVGGVISSKIKENSMDFNHDNVREMVEEDRLSRLPDELLHKILSCLDIKVAVRTCLLSSRWKLLWTSMACLNFSNVKSRDLCLLSKFVTDVLSHRNHEIQLSSVKLDFKGSGDDDFVKKIADYAFSHNVQELAVNNWPTGPQLYPPCLFSSQSLKHFTFTIYRMQACITPTTPWDFPSLTTLHLQGTGLCGDIFSKCVNLKNLTLKSFRVTGVKVFNIITPRLSNLMLINTNSSKVINIIAPQLENLIITKCQINHLNVPPGLPYFSYTDNRPPPIMSKDGFRSLNKVNICISIYWSPLLHQEEYARRIIDMLEKLHSARYLTLNADIVECISSFPDLLLEHSSPFSNLICLTIKKEILNKVKMSIEARNFLLDNSPNATCIMEEC